MGIKTGIRIAPVLIVLAVAAAALLYVYPKTKQERKDGDREVILQVLFTPSPRSGNVVRDGGILKDQVSVQATAPGQTLTERAVVSPWVQTMYLKKGQTVTLHAEQFFGESLRCLVSQPRKQTRRSHHGPSEVNCVHKVI